MCRDQVHSLQDQEVKGSCPGPGGSTTPPQHPGGAIMAGLCSHTQGVFSSVCAGRKGTEEEVSPGKVNELWKVLGEAPAE